MGKTLRLAVLLPLLVACGGGSSAIDQGTQPIAEEDAGGGTGTGEADSSTRVDDPDASAPDGSASPDGGPDTALWCGASTAPVSDQCSAGYPCSGTEGTCGSEYTCLDHGGGTRPPIDGCSAKGRAGEGYLWCCPATCIDVPWLAAGLGCLPGMRARSCPGATDPGPGCTRSTASFFGYCCPG